MRRRRAVRPGVAVVLGFGVGFVAAACSSGGFACEGDEQCSLAGEPGRCVSGGRCAYPEPACPSGLAYPQGAPENAGECVPYERDSDDGESEGSTGEPTGTSTGASPVPTGDADSSGDPPGCGDPYEPNDDEAEAAAVQFGGAEGCLSTWDAFLEDPLDADWFVLEASDPACPTSAELTFVTDPPLELCVLPQCPDGSPAMILACDGSLVELMSGQACCSSEQLRVTMLCEAGEPEVIVGIAASSETPACLPYQAAVL